MDDCDTEMGRSRPFTPSHAASVKPEETIEFWSGGHKARREWPNCSVRQVSGPGHTRRIKNLPYQEPSKVAGQKFATHVAFAPQSERPSRSSAFAHRAQKHCDVQTPSVKHLTIFENACGCRSILPTGPQCHCSAQRGLSVAYCIRTSRRASRNGKKSRFPTLGAGRTYQ